MRECGLSTQPRFPDPNGVPGTDAGAGPAVSRSEGGDVAPDQYGASAHRVGRRVMAAAHVLHYGVGVPVRKVPAVLRALTGVELSQGAISQDALRRARGTVGDAYHKLRGSVRASPLVHTDDTGWRVDGGPAFLMRSKRMRLRCTRFVPSPQRRGVRWCPRTMEG